MPDTEAPEYEVEGISRAKVVRKGNKKIWNFYVQWKGYPSWDSTWEPPDSFDEESQHFVQSFWERVNDPRDMGDLSLFRIGEQIYPSGRPRLQKPAVQPVRATKGKEKAKPKSVTTAASDLQDDSEAEVKSLIDRGASSQKGKRRASEPEDIVDVSASKRKRARRSLPDEGEDTAQVKHKSSRTRSKIVPSSRMPTTITKAAEPSSSRRVTSSTHEVTRIGPPVGAKKKGLKKARSEPSSDEILVVSKKSGDARKSSRSGPGDEVVPPSPPESDQGSLFGNQDADQEVNEIEGPPKVPAKPAMPAHRLREANPLVKMVIDVPMGEGLSNSISVKARLAARDAPGASGSEPQARPHRSKPGPGRNSGGMQSGSSVLTSVKGVLKSVGGRIKSFTQSATGMDTEEDKTSAANGTQAEEEVNATGGSVAPAEPSVEQGGVDEAPAVIEPAEAPPTAELLLEMAGYDQKEAEALPDFEEDLVIVEDDTDMVVDNTNRHLTEPGPSNLSANKTNNAHAAWKQTTIFGPLGIGSDLVQKPAEGVVNSTSEAARPVFSLVFDSSAHVPVFLKDIAPAKSSMLKPLNEVVSNSEKGPPGKFYKDRFAMAMVDSFKAEGSSARIALDMDDEDAKRHYERFQARLRAGELFIGMIGTKVLAFCSSTNTELASKLGMSPNLIGLGDNILVAEVVIDQFSAYCDAVLNADDERW